MLMILDWKRAESSCVHNPQTIPRKHIWRKDSPPAKLSSLSQHCLSRAHPEGRTVGKPGTFSQISVLKNKLDQDYYKVHSLDRHTTDTKIRNLFHLVHNCEHELSEQKEWTECKDWISTWFCFTWALIMNSQWDLHYEVSSHQLHPSSELFWTTTAVPTLGRLLISKMQGRTKEEW